MKNLTLVTLFLFCSALAFGQCDKNLELAAVKTEYLDASGVVQRTVDEESTIEINKTQIIVKGGDDPKMTGTIDPQSVSCNWSTAFKEGKTVFKAIFKDPNEGEFHVTFTFEGKAGVVTALMEIAETPDRKIRVNLTTFKEK